MSSNISIHAPIEKSDIHVCVTQTRFFTFKICLSWSSLSLRSLMWVKDQGPYEVGNEFIMISDQWVLQLLPREFESDFWRNLSQGFKEHLTIQLATARYRIALPCASGFKVGAGSKRLVSACKRHGPIWGSRRRYIAAAGHHLCTQRRRLGRCNTSSSETNKPSH